VKLLVCIMYVSSCEVSVPLKLVKVDIWPSDHFNSGRSATRQAAIKYKPGSAIVTTRRVVAVQVGSELKSLVKKSWNRTIVVMRPLSGLEVCCRVGFRYAYLEPVRKVTARPTLIFFGA
jgi:hypothetical protein